MSVRVPPSGSRGQRQPPRALMGIMVWLMRTSHRLGARRMDGMPVILLTTRGAHSSELRTAPVIGFPDGDSAWLVVASAAGAARHPAWFFNLARHPEDVTVEAEGRRVEVVARSLEGEERDQAWQRITARSPRFTGYQQTTDREIPVVRLAAPEE